MRACNPLPKRLIRSWLLGLEKRRILLHAAGPLESIREENSRQRGNQETWNWSSRKSHWSWRQGWSSLIRNIPSGTRKERDDKWPRKWCQRDAGGDGVDRKLLEQSQEIADSSGGGRAIQGKDRISTTRYTSDEFWRGQDESIVHTCGGWRK